MSDRFERDHALMEAHRNDAAEAYFTARHPMLDTIANRRTFEAGFARAWNIRSEQEAGRGYAAAPAGDLPDSLSPTVDLSAIANFKTDPALLAQIAALKPGEKA
jgi:hypothetical protein